MVTIFAIPKSFYGHIETIQRNAIQSWLALRPRCEIILFGDEPGVKEIASEYQVIHIPVISKNDYGTPLISSAFECAQKIARNDILCYSNADIIFFQDLISAIGKITYSRYLIVGRRWNLDIVEPLPYQTPQWEIQLRKKLVSCAQMSGLRGSDYFIFRKGTLEKIPDFAVGRPVWDNWMIYHARAKGYVVVDATQAITDVHQNHNYTHVPESREASWEGPEGDHNRFLISPEHTFDLIDATHTLDGNGKLYQNIDDEHLRRRIKRLSVLMPVKGWKQEIQTGYIRLLLGIFHRRNYYPFNSWRQAIYLLTI